MSRAPFKSSLDDLEVGKRRREIFPEPGLKRVNSRAKGKNGELEFAAFLRDRGYAEARRGQQYRGGDDSPDVVGVAGVHHEVKRTERLALYDAVDQARRDAAPNTMPVVAHRCNSKPRSCRGEWLFVLGADDYFELLRQAGYK